MEDFFDKLPNAFEEPKVETPVETPQTPPTETPKVETPVEAPKEQQFDIAFFNKTYNTDFKSDEDIKAVLQLPSKAKELEDRLKDYDTVKTDLEFYKNSNNPLQWFASENEFRAQQFLKKNPDKDAGVAVRLFSADLNKMSDVDLLVQYELLTGVVGGEPTARELVASKYDVDLDNPSEWSAIAKTKLQRMAGEVRKEINLLKDEIKLPETVDLNTKREAQAKADQEALANIKKGWEDMVPRMMSQIKEVKISDYDKDGKEEPLISYSLDDEGKAQLQQEVMATLIANRTLITEESVRKAGQDVLERYALRNLPKILKAYGTTLVAKVDELKDKETHNPAPIKTEQKPEGSEADKMKAEASAWLLNSNKFVPRR